MHPQIPRPKAKSFRIWTLRLLIASATLYALLLIPDPNHSRRGAGRTPFQWKRDAWWSELEKQFSGTRGSGCEAAAAGIESGLENLRSSARLFRAQSLPPASPAFSTVETNIFHLAASIAACPQRLSDYVATVTGIRSAVKEQSQHWDLDQPAARQTLYRVMFGSRMALEEVMLQAAASHAVPELTRGDEEPSPAPAVSILGLALRSGDILVSRGGAATSAMIARANDYPGSFSHVALLHVDEVTRRASIIESLSQQGVVITPVEEFLKDKKLRVLVLRLRADLPALIKDPLLPHRAATWMLAAAKQKHIPYDFTLNHQDHAAQFCSEVAATAYQAHGIDLWTGLTYISLPTAIGWLSSLGVQQFETKEPADLEYDPQLRIVGEWREPATLFKAHLDDAATDVMLELAPSGAALDYNPLLLPLARIVKAYSIVLNSVGKVGPIPQGMSATVGLRVDRYQKEHARLVSRLNALAQEFRMRNGYAPPYWELVKLGQQAYREARVR